LIIKKANLTALSKLNVNPVPLLRYLLMLPP